MSKLVLGAVVHYATTTFDQKVTSENPYAKATETCAAIVSGINEKDDTADLTVFVVGGAPIAVRDVKQGSEPGQWEWPVFETEAEDFELTAIIKETVREELAEIEKAASTESKAKETAKKPKEEAEK